jgi:hypothetical protein
MEKKITDLKDYPFIVTDESVHAHGEQWIRVSRIEKYILPYVDDRVFKR